jgi:pimeloyl-ACP methyl ester carboxylesterase
VSATDVSTGAPPAPLLVPPPREPRLTVRPLTLADKDVCPPGTLTVPAGARGVVVFVEGGGARFDAHRALLARELTDGRIAALEVELLTAEEAGDHRNAHDVPLLAARLELVLSRLARVPVIRRLPVGLLGAGAGAAAALAVAADLGAAVAAVVSHGGRPDLVRQRLAEVTAPTLLVVGGRDLALLELGEQALALMRCPAALRVVPGATHLFEEPGAMHEASRLASDWFRGHFAGSGRRR